jgi:hypothetical protein
MNIENAVRTLTDLSAVDDRLAAAEDAAEADVELRDRRAALRGSIPDVVLAAYDALARVGRRPVVVGVRCAHCCGCHLRLPPQLDASVRRRQSLAACPHCRRLLYPAPPPAEPKTASEPVREAPVERPVGVATARGRGARAGKPRSQHRVPAAKRVTGSRANQPRASRRPAAAVRERWAFELELSLRQ